MHAETFCCPKCASPLTATETGFVCASAHFYVSRDGIFDFVGGDSGTLLDVSTYDQQKRVSIEASRSLFSSIKKSSNGAICDDLGDVLEIGSGTGMLSLSMLSDSAFRSAVITDISREMLLLNRSRMLIEAPASLDKITFATYSGSSRLFADQSFDLCIANSVLHHVENYQQMLSDLARAIRPEGVAMFVEPAIPYHDAMTRSMADALCELLTSGTAMEDVQKIAAWISDTRFRLAFPGDPLLSAMEDKHLFSRDALTKAAYASGFDGVEVLPNFIDRNGLLGCREYCRELGLPAKFSDIFFEIYRNYADVHFRGLAQEDHSGMYICIFRKH